MDPKKLTIYPYPPASIPFHMEQLRMRLSSYPQHDSFLIHFLDQQAKFHILLARE